MTTEPRSLINVDTSGHSPQTRETERGVLPAMVGVGGTATVVKLTAALAQPTPTLFSARTMSE